MDNRSRAFIPDLFKKIVRSRFPRITSIYRRYRYRIVHLPSLTYAFGGEDTLISLILSGTEKKIRWVDVGCAHPIFDNNTYRFYRKGGLGVNVDARKSLNLSHRILRPRDRFINAIVSDQTDSKFVQFFVNQDDPHMSSVSPDWAVGHLDSRNDLKSIRVTSTTLSEIFQENLDFLGLQTLTLRTESVLILNIDVEGHDFSVLLSNDWEKFKPDIICIETIESGNISDFMSGNIYQLLLTKNYVLSAFTSLTSIFVLQAYRQSQI